MAPPNLPAVAAPRAHEMTLRLADKWVWDFWLLQARDEHHIFYLQAPRTLEVPAAASPPCVHRPRRLERPSRLAGSPRRAPPRAGRKLGRPRDLDRQRDRARRALVHALHRHQPPRGGTDPANRPRRLGRSRALGQAPGESGARGRPALVRPPRPLALARPVLARPLALPASRRRLVPLPDHGQVAARRQPTLPVWSATRDP